MFDVVFFALYFFVYRPVHTHILLLKLFRAEWALQKFRLIRVQLVHCACTRKRWKWTWTGSYLTFSSRLSGSLKNTVKLIRQDVHLFTRNPLNLSIGFIETKIIIHLHWKHFKNTSPIIEAYFARTLRSTSNSATYKMTFSSFFLQLPQLIHYRDRATRFVCGTWKVYKFFQTVTSYFDWNNDENDTSTLVWANELMLLRIYFICFNCLNHKHLEFGMNKFSSEAALSDFFKIKQTHAIKQLYVVSIIAMIGNETIVFFYTHTYIFI